MAIQTLTNRPPPIRPTTPNQTRVVAIACEAVTFDDILAGEPGAPAPLPRFRMTAYTGGPMRVAGWRFPVILDLAGLAIPSQARPIRFGHDPLSGVGHSDAIRVEQGQLVATGVVSRDTAAAREVVVSSKNGFPWQASVGASVEEFEFVRDGQQAIVNGRTFDGPVNVVRKSTLGEISFVDLGADGATSASVAAQVSGGIPIMASTLSSDSLESDSLESEASPSVPGAGGPAVAPLAGAAKPTISAGAAPTGDPPLSVEELRAQAIAETNRIAAIRRLCQGKNSEIEAKAIAEGWDSQRTELEVLRATRPTLSSGHGPAIHIHDAPVTGRMLEAACVLAGKGIDVERAYDDQTLDEASRKFRGGIGLRELFLEAAWANGYSGRSFREAREVLRCAFGRSVQAAYSTIDIGQILSNVANKFLLDGFFAVERIWREICAVRNVSDFKTVTSYRLIGKDQYEPVAPGGEIKHGTLGNEVYTNKADTYGLMLSIDRRDLINDDLGAITTVPRKLGRGSGLKINDVFWTTFLNNSAFFSVGNANLLTGATTNLSLDSLTTAEVLFNSMTDADGKPTGIEPAFMLVPPALGALAQQLYKSLEMRDMTASSRQPTANPHQNKFEPKVSRYLSNGAYPGNSAKAWYLLANPNDLPVIEVAFLNGNESPTIETAEADFNVLGVQMRGVSDFGCNLVDPRGGVRVRGEV